MSQTAVIASLQISPAHREPMRMLDSVRAIQDRGLEGDRQTLSGGGGSRQVLLMDEETLAAFGLSAGVVKENITTRGLALKTLTPGTRLRIGDAILEITKSCTPCGRMDEIQPGLRAALEGQRGMLARVVQGGRLNVGDAIAVVK
ncbi:MAG: MOSC domain-containing protein [Chloroflexi bacterium]|nr:MOSC domain-containing protein [Chloroflexota bacterium]